MNLGRNIIWNIVAFVWLSLLIVLVTPFMVRRLGLEAFGLWAVITAFGGYLTAMDLGLGNALIRFMAVENERSDWKALERYLRSGVTLQTGLGIAASLALFFSSGILAHRLIRVAPELVNATVVSFRLSAIAILLGFVSVAYGGVPAALHRFDLLALRTILLLTLQYLSIAAVLGLGGGLTQVMTVYALGAGAIAVYMVLVCRNLLPGINLWPGWHPEAVRDLMRFGRMKFPAQVSVTLLQQFDRVALGIFLPVSMVSFYAVPVRISQRLGQVAENVATPFYPLVASHLVAERTEALRRQYRHGTRIVLAAVCGASVVLGGLAPSIFQVWLGNDFAHNGTLPFRVLLLAYGLSALFTLPSVAADAAGRPGMPALFLVAGALVHVGIIWITVPRWGLVGAATGVLCGFMIPVLFGIPVMHRRIQALPSLTDLFHDVRGILLAAGLTLLFSFPIARVLAAASGWIPLLVSLTACSVLYLLFLFTFRALKVEDIRRVTRSLLSKQVEPRT